MDRRHKILLNVVVIVLIFAPLFFVLRHREWLSLYMNALSLFIILYMCWGFFRIACARIAETDQPWKKGLIGFWSLAMAVLLSLISCWISSPAGAGSLPLAALSSSRLSLVVMKPEH